MESGLIGILRINLNILENGRMMFSVEMERKSLRYHNLFSFRMVPAMRVNMQELSLIHI